MCSRIIWTLASSTALLLPLQREIKRGKKKSRRTIEMPRVSSYAGLHFSHSLPPHGKNATNSGYSVEKWLQVLII